MSVSANATKIQYAANGIAITFAYNFPIQLNTDIQVIFTEDGVDTTKVLTTDYSVTGVGSESGGNVVFVVAPPATVDRITILRNVDITQGTDYIQNDDFPAQSHENALDKITMVAQQLYEMLSRVPMIPKSELTTVNMTLPEASTRAGKLLLFDSSGNVSLIDPANVASSQNPIILVTSSPEGVTTGVQGALAFDTVNKIFYIKDSVGTGNTGWLQLI